jgi:photosystem II stability/assembly factor-like uncharacterized protein
MAIFLGGLAAALGGAAMAAPAMAATAMAAPAMAATAMAATAMAATAMAAMPAAPAAPAAPAPNGVHAMLTSQASEAPTAPQGPPPLPVPIGTAALHWRLVGPFRGGRVLAVSGVPGRPEEFYFGAVGGGVWRSTDAGRVWKPVFDGPPSGSIGALAVAPSNPDVLYVGTGEADMRSDISYGDGMYRSADGGRSWQSIGLRDTRQIARIVVDPHDPDTLLVAALGHGFGPNAQRGVFRSTDGGKSWRQVLRRDDDTGAIDLAADPADPRVVYAALWNVHRPPWSVYAPLGGPGGGLFKSTDGGATWHELSGHGLPAGPFGRIGLAVTGAAGENALDAGAPARSGRAEAGSAVAAGRVYALIDDPHQPGMYVSDDGGGSWQRTGTDSRVTSRPWYFGGVTADPHDADTVYVANVSLYRSTDRGRTFAAVKGAPGGDDYHSLWIDPGDSRRRILGGDQGAVVTVNGGATWSSWFNQPTAQIYHVATDDRYPYTIYGAQQDSGTVAIRSRGDFGQITFRDWFSPGTGESGYLLPDPDDPEAGFGGNPGGQLFRFSRRTNQIQDISPTPGPAAGAPPRYPWTAALAISPLPPHALYQGAQYVYRSTDHGMSWTVISPDLTAGTVGSAGSAAGGASTARSADGASGAKDHQDQAVIYSLAPSPLDARQIWAGTDNGRVRLTRDDGAAWRDVTPPGLPAWSMVSAVEASRFDAGTAYLAIDRHQMDDLRPYILRTHDFGATWTPAAGGAAGSSIPVGAYVHAVREDPYRRGLLYAATETGVFVSFDDGDRWQPLQLDLPAASVRDLAVHGDDLIAATHGRSFWVLGGLAPLRQLDAAVVAAPAHLFTPAPAVRRRRGENHETPLPADMAVGENPPNGVLIDYWLAADLSAGDKKPAAGDSDSDGEKTGRGAPAVTLEVLDAAGALVRRFTSAEPPPRPTGATASMGTAGAPGPQPFPDSWLRPAAPPSAHAGLNRFVWDLRYAPPPVLHPEAGDDAVAGLDTPFEPQGPLVLPGTYRLRLTAAAHSETVEMRVEADPRQTLATGTLDQQVAFALRLDAALAAGFEAIGQLRDLDRQLEKREAELAAAHRDLAAPVAKLRHKIAALTGGGQDSDDDDDAAAAAHPTLTGVHAGLAALATAVGKGDAAPTAQAVAAFDAWRAQQENLLAAAAALRNADLADLDRRLAAAGLPKLGKALPNPAAP